MTCTYCGHELKKHEPNELGVECKVCQGTCGDFNPRRIRKRKNLEPILKLIKDNT
jgi:hypothetical protein